MKFCEVCGRFGPEPELYCGQCGTPFAGSPGHQEDPDSSAPAPESAAGGDPPPAAAQSAGPFEPVHAPMTVLASPAQSPPAQSPPAQPLANSPYPVSSAFPVNAASTMAAQQPPPFVPPNPPLIGYPAPGPPGSPGPGVPPVPSPGPKRSGVLTTFVTVVVVLAVGAGVATWLLVNKPTSSGSAQAQTSGSQTASPRPTSNTRRSTSRPGPTATASVQPPSPTPSVTEPASGGGEVALGPDAASDPQASAVQAFVTDYFNAINDHNYPEYEAILTPAAASALSQEKFQSGFGSTHDFNATINSISSISGGLTADLSFTSYQRVSQSANHSTCTRWESVTLFLEDYNGQYRLGQSHVSPVFSDC
jgi:hypothetical protein